MKWKEKVSDKVWLKGSKKYQGVWKQLNPPAKGKGEYGEGNKGDD